MTELNQPSDQIQLEQATLLAEVEVYLEFGYKDQAAQALHDYLKQTSDAEPAQYIALLELYLELDNLNDFSEVLESEYQHGVLARSSLDQLLQRALKMDPDHMVLLGLAERYCPHILPESHQHTDQSSAQMALPVEDTVTKTGTPGDIQSEPPPNHVNDTPSGTSATELRLVNGTCKILPLTASEQLSISTLLPAGTRSRLLFNSGYPEAAIRSLTNEFKVSKRPLTPLVSLLRFCFLQKDIETYARFLWRLNQILAPHGGVLRNHLLSYGQKMGEHPVFTALLGSVTNADVYQIGLDYGYVTHTMQEKQPLITLHKAERTVEGAETDPLREADSRLDDGQITQAIVILENALLYNPEDLSLYPALFTLYEKTEDLTRLEAFSQKLRTSYQLLPADAMLTMNQLHERMQTKSTIA